MSATSEPLAEPKHPWPTPSQRKAMSTEALRAHCYFECEKILREKESTARRIKALRMAEKELESRK